MSADVAGRLDPDCGAVSVSLVGLDASELRIAAVEVDGDDEFPADGSSDWGGVSALDRPN